MCVFWYMQLYMSWYIRSFFGFNFLNILFLFKYPCTNIFHRRSLYTFYMTWHVRHSVSNHWKLDFVCLEVWPGWHQKKNQNWTLMALCMKRINQWIPLTKGRFCENRFHTMTSFLKMLGKKTLCEDVIIFPMEMLFETENTCMPLILSMKYTIWY